ncbi:MAG: hypothetical protein ACOC90_04640 [Bacteroidota bacterium]
MKDIILIAQLIIFFTYVGVINNKFGVLSSISASTYYLKGQDRWWFLAAFWPVGLLMLAQGLGVFGFIMAAGLMFTGLTIHHRTNIAQSQVIHYIGSSATVVAGMIAGIFLYGAVIPVIVFAGLSIMTYIKRPNDYTWWIEIWAVIVLAFILFAYR